MVKVRFLIFSIAIICGSCAKNDEKIDFYFSDLMYKNENITYIDNFKEDYLFIDDTDWQLNEIIRHRIILSLWSFDNNFTVSRIEKTTKLDNDLYQIEFSIYDIEKDKRENVSKTIKIGNEISLYSYPIFANIESLSKYVHGLRLKQDNNQNKKLYNTYNAKIIDIDDKKISFKILNKLTDADIDNCYMATLEVIIDAFAEETVQEMNIRHEVFSNWFSDRYN